MAQTNESLWTLAHQPLPGLFAVWEPRIELVEQEEAYLLQAELPGMQRDDMTIEYHNGVLTIRGEQTITSAADQAVPRSKHGYRAFARRFILSQPIESEAMTTTYTQGVLAVHLPKAAVERSQQHPVQVAS
jgi:HSP20 family protein